MAITKDKRRTIGEGRGSVKPLPPSRFESPCRAPAEQVYDLLSNLSRHLEWGGERQGETTRLLTMESPPGPATVGTEFRTTGSDGKVARWHDRSVVTEASRPSVVEFVTEGIRYGKPGSTPMEATTIHRYEIVATAEGCLVAYQGQVTRYSGFPRIVRAPVIGRWLLAYAAKFMRKGFDALVALAEEEATGSAV
jgi:Polyketide cyclase / dehydrase and lipid transport